MRLLALDVGTRRTGIAYLDTVVGIPLPLDTIHHTTADELMTQVLRLSAERKIEKFIVGLPRLPSGDEGSQAAVSRQIGAALEKAGASVSFVDERYTSRKGGTHKNMIPVSKFDGDAAAACALLSGKIDY